MKTYRLLLLDDEEIVLRGIQKVYDLPSFGFELAGAFTNPVKALERLDELIPDLIITDVKMPQMTGLEFTAEVKKKYPDTEVVILSGYDDFSYAQTAVRIGVSDYLLKPIKKDDFGNMLHKMYRKIDEKQKKEASWQRLLTLLENSYTELRNRFYLALTESGIFDEGLYNTLKQHGHAQLEDEDFVLFRVDIYRISTYRDFVSEVGKLTQELETILSDYGQVFDFWSDESVYFVLYDLWEEQYEDVRDTVRAFVEVRKQEGLSLALGVSPMRKGIHELFEARNDCVRSIFMQEAKIDMDSPKQNPIQKRDDNNALPYLELENLFRAITASDMEGVVRCVDNVFELPPDNLYEVSRDYFISTTFLILLRSHKLQEKYESKEEIITSNMLDLANLRREYPTAKEQKQLVLETSLRLADLAADHKEVAPSRLIQSALEYIEGHFTENISLQEVADEIRISKNYLSDIFKKETGVTFINYVTNLRIERAKELLSDTDLRMYEVANAVGYNDYAYFSQIFKKHTGKTLSAYRKGH